MGPSVDPLGEVLMKLLPEGFRPLLAPAAALPAVLLVPLLVEVPVVVPLVGEPVVTPLAADPPVAGVPPAEPPLWAKAKELRERERRRRGYSDQSHDSFPLLLSTKDKQRRVSRFPPFLKPTQT